jgi:hypothetical protein
MANAELAMTTFFCDFECAVVQHVVEYLGSIGRSLATIKVFLLVTTETKLLGRVDCFAAR